MSSATYLYNMQKAGVDLGWGEGGTKGAVAPPFLSKLVLG